MADDNTVELLVTVGERTRELDFSKEESSYEKLLEVIKEEFGDVLQPDKEISHLEIWREKWNKFVELKPAKVARDVTGDCQLRVVFSSQETAGSIQGNNGTNRDQEDDSQEQPKPVVSYCTEPLDEEPMEIEGSSASGSTGQEGPSAYALETKLWVGRDRLKVYFLNPEVLKDEGWMCGKSLLNVDNILSWANSWNPSTSPDIPDFRQTDKQEDADIRVKFEGGSCWSKVGRSAELVTDKSLPTMVLALKGRPADEQRFLVIHEFGHALGLFHEHQRHDFWRVAGTVLDMDKMKSDRRMKTVNFDRDFLPTLPSGTETEYDPDSTMHYWFDVNWLKNAEHRKEKKVRSDRSLTEEQRAVLLGIHKRNMSYASAPSAKDLQFLQQLYARNNSAGGPGSTSSEPDYGDPGIPPPPPKNKVPIHDDPHIELPSSILNTLYTAAYDARSAWSEIGMALGMKKFDLRSIEMNKLKDVEKCFCEMLIQWLQSRRNCYLDSFLQALRSPTVEQGELCTTVKEEVLKELWKEGALSIEDWNKYMSRKRPSPHTVADNDLQVSDV